MFRKKDGKTVYTKGKYSEGKYQQKTDPELYVGVFVVGVESTCQSSKYLRSLHHS